MRLTSEDLVRLKQKPGYGIASDTRRPADAPGQELREHCKLQEREKIGRKPADHRPGDEGAKDSDSARYRVRIDFRFSDRRVRDLEGSSSTVLDALIAARRSMDSYQ